MVSLELVRNCLDTVSLPAEVAEHGQNSLLNWLGLAIGASQHQAIEIALATALELGAPGEVAILGRREKTDRLWAALINGMSSHLFDYDDTHLATIHHPSGPVAPVVFVLGEKYQIAADKLLRAFVLGCEAELRISRAIYPSHYDLGWHITGTTGVFGAAVAAGILLDLSEEQLLYALGIAGTQASGLREMFGTMTKSFHPGKAAQNGLLAAMLAKRGFTSSRQILEAKRGFASVLAPNYDLNWVNANWGEKWEFLENTFKPYACGIVLHPTIDACLGLRSQAEPEEVKEIRLRVNPYVLELTGKTTPQTGLEGKFSVYHTAAVAYLDGDASEEQYADAKVRDPKAIALRAKIRTEADPNLSEDQAEANLIRQDGSEAACFIAHATGSLQKPMTREALERKFRKLTQPVIGKVKSNALLSQFDGFVRLSDFNAVIKNCRP